MANTEVNMGDEPSPNIPNLTTLRVAKTEETIKNRFDPDPIYSLHKAKYNGEYINIIQDICLDRFYVQYYSAEQIHIYNNYVKCLGVQSQIAIDATGGVVRSIKRPDGQRSRPIFLYDITIHDRIQKKILSVGNMLSERHDTVSISHFLQSWRKTGAKVPKTVVCDMSLALMAAAVQSFTEFTTLQDYLNHCAFIIENEVAFVPPNCYIKNDIAHTVKLITQYPSLKKTITRTKSFYVRAICLVIQETNLKRMEELLESIFTVALYETEGNFPDGAELPSEKSKKYIQDQISKEIFPTTLSEIGEDDSNVPSLGENPNDNITDTIESETITTGFKDWVLKIKMRVEAQKNDVGDRNNQQYCPALVKDLIKMCHLLPTWSAIMVSYFNYGNRTTTSTFL